MCLEVRIPKAGNGFEKEINIQTVQIINTIRLEELRLTIRLNLHGRTAEVKMKAFGLVPYLEFTRKYGHWKSTCKM